MSAELTPVERVQLDDLVEHWHRCNHDDRPLHEILGLTWNQYRHWFETAELPDGWHPKPCTWCAAA